MGPPYARRRNVRTELELVNLLAQPAFARDMLNSNYAGCRLIFQLFAQSERVMEKTDRIDGDSAVRRWFAAQPSVRAPPGAADAAP
jgi:hypothetical protein